MSKADRIARVLEYIVDHKHTTYDEISRNTGLDRKSISRYVQYLKNKGLMYTRPGTNGGVFMKEDCIMINAVLTVDQFNSLVGLSAREPAIFRDEKEVIDTIVDSVII